jgi:hypothetical protein
LEREIKTAKANLLYAEQQFTRKSQLAANGFASCQDRNEALGAFNSTESLRHVLADASAKAPTAKLDFKQFTSIHG